MESETAAGANRDSDALPSHPRQEPRTFQVPKLDVSSVPTSDTKSCRAMVSQSTNYEKFELSHIQELNGLVDRGVFTLVPISAANGFRIYDARFVDYVKNKGTHQAFTKSRFVVMALNDKNHCLLTGAPIVQRSLQHLLL